MAEGCGSWTLIRRRHVRWNRSRRQTLDCAQVQKCVLIARCSFLVCRFGHVTRFARSAQAAEHHAENWFESHGRWHGLGINLLSAYGRSRRACGGYVHQGCKLFYFFVLAGAAGGFSS